MIHETHASAASSELVHEALRSMSDVSVLVFDRDMRIEAVHGGAVERHGYVPERLIGRRAPDVLPAAAWERLGPVYVRALAGETITLEGAAHDGAAIYETTFQPVHRDGMLIGGMATSRDVTQRRRAEADLREAERRFQRTFTHAPVGMLLLRAGRIVQANDALAQLVGLAAADLIGRDPLDFVEPGDAALARASIARVGEGHEQAPQERRIRGADGRVLRMHLRYSNLSEAGEEPLVVIHFVDRTAELDAQDAREAALVQFETSFREAPIGMCVVELDGRFRRVNAALCSLLGREEPALLACGFQELTHPDDLAADLELLESTLAGERTGYEMDKRYLRADGTVVECRLSVALVRDPDGRPAHFLSQIVDLSSLHALRRELGNANARLQAILDNSPAAIYTRDLEQRWEVTNPETCRIVGLEEHELIGRSMRDTLSPELFDHLDAHDRAVLDAGRPITFEEVAPDARTGRTHYWWSSKFPIRDAEGRVVGLGGMSLDVTEREEAIRELRAARELFEAAFESAPVGKVLSRRMGDGSTVVVKANPAFGEMVGVRAGALAGTDPSVLVHPADLPVRARMIDDLLAGRRTSGELRFRHACGHDVWALVAPAIVRSAGGEQLFVLQALDISERKRFEAQLRHLADHDSLTGQLSRRRFEQELARETARVGRGGRPSSLLILDLDGFKAVNDTFGHPAGDALLTGIAAALRGVLREVDLLARLGGDEFAVILPETDGAGARVVAEKLVAAVRRSGRVRTAGAQAAVTASVGATTFTAGDADELLGRADAAMYRAKAAGGDRVASRDAVTRLPS